MIATLIVIMFIQAIALIWMLYLIGDRSTERADSILKAIKFAEKEEWYEIAQELREKLKRI